MVLENTYDLVLEKGAKTLVVDAVDCTGNTCLIDERKLTVEFPGVSGVRVEVRQDDGSTGTASGSLAAVPCSIKTGRQCFQASTPACTTLC